MFLYILDGLDQPDPTGSNPLKNQAVAFLQATSFLKSKLLLNSFIFLPLYLLFILIKLLLYILFSISVPLIVTNLLVIIIEILAG